MNDPAGAAQRAKWRQYFAQVLDGSEAEVEAAADGAMAAIARRADQAGVVAAGRAAAAAYRASGGRPARPAPVQAPPPVAPAARVGGGGIVTGLQQRQEMSGRSYIQVWNFRLERRDANGNPLPPVPVEIRARSIRGQIANGDLVEIPTKPRPMQLRNLTTGATLRARGKPRPVLRWIFTILFLCAFALFVVYAIKSV